MDIEVLCYDSFSLDPNMGNPAGVCFDCDNLSEEKMLFIAKEVGFSETAFLMKSQNANLRIRFFTPGQEVDMCGHALVASIVALFQNKTNEVEKKLTVEVNAGVLNISYNAEKNEVHMEQKNAKFEAFEGDKKALMETVGLTETSLNNAYPIMFGSTGIWTLVVPVNSVEDCQKMMPNNKAFEFVLDKYPLASTHFICEETINENCVLHARHFSGARMGTVEDPVTGTATGVTGAYYIKYMKPDLNSCDILVEQGQDMGKNGFCRTFNTKTANGEITAKIAGTAVFTERKILKDIC